MIIANSISIMSCPVHAHRIIFVDYKLSIYQDWSQYGIDWEGPLPQGDSNEELVMPDIANPLSTRDFDDLLEHVNPLAHDEGYGIDLYICACTFMSERVHS